MNKKNNVPFVFTYHPKLKSLTKTTKDSLYLSYMNDEVKRPLHQTLRFHFIVHARSAVI